MQRLLALVIVSMTSALIISNVFAIGESPAIGSSNIPAPTTPRNMQTTSPSGTTTPINQDDRMNTQTNTMNQNPAVNPAPTTPGAPGTMNTSSGTGMTK